MRTALFAASLALVVGAIPAHAQEPGVKVWINKRGDVERGDRVRVYARAETDGYLVVLNAEPDGRIRVLFPLDPLEDNFVRGARDVEIRGRGERDAFRVYDSTGTGTVFAAFSRDPFQLQPFVKDDHWDYAVLDTWTITPDRDPEAELTALVERMTPNTRFTYDLTQYLVEPKYASANYYYNYPYPSVSNYWYGGWNPWGWSFGVSTGWWNPWSAWWYDPWYSPWYGSYAWSAYGWYRPYFYYPVRYYYPVAYWPSGYWYRGYYFYGDGTYRYNRGGEWTVGRYTFKPLDRSGWNQVGIRPRSRSSTPSVAGVLRRVDLADASPSLTGRRPAPVAAGPTQVAPARRAAPVAGARQPVRADGWGMTDGRRTIAPSTSGRRNPDAPAVQPSTDGRRGAPSGTPAGGVDAQRPTRAIDGNRDNGATGRRTTPDAPATGTRTTTPPATRQPAPTRKPPDEAGARRPSQSYDAAPQVTPQRSETPQARRPASAGAIQPRAPVRSAPSASPPRSAPRPQQSAPRPSVRPSSPSRAAPARPSAPAARRPSGGGGHGHGHG